MTLAALLAFLKANEALIATILFVLSEVLGASPKIKANGILSLVLLQVQARLKEKGAVDPTP
jgi:hypothetical protein